MSSSTSYRFLVTPRSLTLPSTVGEKDPENVVRGLQAAINNPRVSEAAKQRDRERIEEINREYDASDYQGVAETPDADESYLVEDEEVAKITQRTLMSGRRILALNY